MEFLYIGIGIVIGIVGILFLDVDSISKLFSKKEETFDDKAEYEENEK